jgi:hypothetical protein
MRTPILVCLSLAFVAACSPRTPAVGAAPGEAPCAGTRVLAVQNGADEAVDVYASSGRTSTLIGTVPPGKKDLTIPREVHASSFYAVAISRGALGGSGVSAPVDQRVIFLLDCRK